MTKGGHERELVQQAPLADGWRFDPSALLRAVNVLAGWDAAVVLELLEECLSNLERTPRTTTQVTDASGLALVARLVFPSRDASHPLPAPALGQSDLAAPADQTTWPFFPLSPVDDLPFLVVGGYRAGGALDLRGWFARCAELGEVRRQPLIPRSSPVDGADALIATPQWQILVPQARRHRYVAMIRSQALRASAPAGIPEEATVTLANRDPTEAERLWHGYAKAVRSLALRWDAPTGRFIATAEPQIS